ncbi:uncharacterized protein LOC18445830 [Amborella trichopoda]|uniref:DUF3741 domain-containing protein n=1 Tax=Amborella trichopoda TaxID=13333 RepID=U5DAQ9_AMBTC|nr:uncharacterized protein LOC18445830 [Amborella trichopoda]ERN17488.1 hypothetical protein AMTR_s00059p00053950 [Amborella trichopoda]|eukprot:XP_006856021.1 uncharacterized protein LOC18445830 [Amborella trichopoda]
MAKKSDFTQKLLDDLRLRKELLAMAQSAPDNSKQVTPLDQYEYFKRLSHGSKEGKLYKTNPPKPRPNSAIHRLLDLPSKASEEIVLYENPNNFKSISNLSMALAFAAATGKELNHVLPAKLMDNKKAITHHSRGRSLDLGKKNSDQNSHYYGPSFLQINEIAKGAQKLNQILKACNNNGFELDGISINVGRDLLRGAMDLEASLRMLVKLQEASKQVAHTHRNDIRLIEEEDRETKVVSKQRKGSGFKENKERETKTKAIEAYSRKSQHEGPRFSFDGSSGNPPSDLREIIASNLTKQKLLTLPSTSSRVLVSDHKAQTPSSSHKPSHRRSMSSTLDSKAVRELSSERSNASSFKELLVSKDANISEGCGNYFTPNGNKTKDDKQRTPENKTARIPNVIAKLMGLEEVPLQMEANKSGGLRAQEPRHESGGRERNSNQKRQGNTKDIDIKPILDTNLQKNVVPQLKNSWGQRGPDPKHETDDRGRKFNQKQQEVSSNKDDKTNLAFNSFKNMASQMKNSGGQKGPDPRHEAEDREKNMNQKQQENTGNKTILEIDLQKNVVPELKNNGVQRNRDPKQETQDRERISNHRQQENGRNRDNKPILEIDLQKYEMNELKKREQQKDPHPKQETGNGERTSNQREKENARNKDSKPVLCTDLQKNVESMKKIAVSQDTRSGTVSTDKNSHEREVVKNDGLTLDKDFQNIHKANLLIQRDPEKMVLKNEPKKKDLNTYRVTEERKSEEKENKPDQNEKKVLKESMLMPRSLSEPATNSETQNTRLANQNSEAHKSSKGAHKMQIRGPQKSNDHVEHKNSIAALLRSDTEKTTWPVQPTVVTEQVLMPSAQVKGGTQEVKLKKGVESKKQEESRPQKATLRSIEARPLKPENLSQELKKKRNERIRKSRNELVTSKPMELEEQLPGKDNNKFNSAPLVEDEHKSPQEPVRPTTVTLEDHGMDIENKSYIQPPLLAMKESSFGDTFNTGEIQFRGPLHGEQSYSNIISQPDQHQINPTSRSDSRKMKVTSTLTDQENHLKLLLINSPKFLNAAVALFNLLIPVGFLHATSLKSADEENKLMADCACEIMRRKSRIKELEIYPSCKTKAVLVKVTCLDELVKELYKDLEHLKFHGDDGADNYNTADYLHKMVQRDVKNKHPDVNSMWGLGWEDTLFAEQEKDELLREVQKHILDGLVQEILGDIIIQ